MEALKLVSTPDGAVRFEVWARPRARASRVTGVRDGAVVVHLAAAPVEGAANAELMATLARALRVPRRSVAVVRGESSRTKLVEVRGLVAAEVLRRLTATMTLTEGS